MGRHPLLDRVLVRPRERGVDELARVGVAGVDGELVAVLRHAPQVVDVGEVELRVHPLGEHVEREGHHVHVAGALAVPEQGALDPLRPGHEGELGGGDPGPPIVVRVEAQDDALAVADVAAEPLDLVGVDVGGRHLDGGRQVDDHPPGRGRLADVHHRLADLDRVVELRPGEALGGVLVDPVRLRAGLGQLADEPCPAHRDLGDTVPVEPEDDAPLEGRGGVVEVDDRPLRARDALEGAGDELGTGLGEDLDGHVVRDRVVLDEVAAEVEVGLRGGGEAHFDLLEAHLHEGLEHPLLAFVVHRVDERLVAVAKVDAAPDGRAGDDPPRPPAVRQVDGRERAVLLDGHPAGRLPGRPGGGRGAPAGRGRCGHGSSPPEKRKPALVSGGGLRNGSSLSAALRSGRPPSGPGKSEEHGQCVHGAHPRAVGAARQPRSRNTAVAPPPRRSPDSRNTVRAEPRYAPRLHPRRTPGGGSGCGRSDIGAGGEGRPGASAPAPGEPPRNRAGAGAEEGRRPPCGRMMRPPAGDALPGSFHAAESARAGERRFGRTGAAEVPGTRRSQDAVPRKGGGHRRGRESVGVKRSWTPYQRALTRSSTRLSRARAREARTSRSSPVPSPRRTPR